MDGQDFAEQVAGVAALADQVRRDLYSYVISRQNPVSRDQAAAGIGVPRHTAKFHLDKLVEAGLLDRDFQRLSGRTGPGAGRPSKLYRRSDRQVSVSLPPRRYDLAAELLANAVENSIQTSMPVLPSLQAAAGERGGILAVQALTAQDPACSPAATVTAACAVLADHGYEPHQDGGSITFANCPFDALARVHTRLVCGMNLALLEAFARGLADNSITARLDPAAARCCVVLDIQ